MFVVKTLDEFKGVLSNPNPHEIYGLVPVDFDVIKETVTKINKIFQENKNCLVYGDVLERHGQYNIIRHNPSFDKDIIGVGFKLNSPIFLNTEKPLFFDRSDLSEVTLQLLTQIIGIHIPEVSFIWKGPRTEINTQ